VARTVLLKTVGGDFTDACCRTAFASIAQRLESRLPELRWRVYRGVTTPDVYAYGTGVEDVDPDRLDVAGLESILQERGALAHATLDILVLKASFAGASQSVRAQCHYVVETDSSPGWEGELFRWYDIEHMPGLAAVQGCVGARRFINEGRGPRSYACYDVASAGVITTEPWLAVRQTRWSDRVRAQFRNTRRTMFRPLVLGSSE